MRPQTEYDHLPAPLAVAKVLQSQLDRYFSAAQVAYLSGLELRQTRIILQRYKADNLVHRMITKGNTSYYRWLTDSYWDKKLRQDLRTVDTGWSRSGG